MADTTQLRGTLARRQSAPAEQSGPPTIATLIERQRPAIEAALTGTGVTAERFARIALTAVRSAQRRDGSNPLLQGDPTSLLAAIMVSAQLGLEPNTPLGHAYLVPYKREVTFILGYKGIVDLARRTGQIEHIDGRAVFPNDEFEFSYGLHPRLHHAPDLDDPGGDAYRYYAVASYKGGGGNFEVISRTQAESHRDRYSSSYRNRPNDSPWTTNFDPMAVKTALRMMSRWLPMSPELHAAMALDEQPVPATLDLHALELAQDVSAAPDAIEEGEPPIEVAGADLERAVQLSPGLTSQLNRALPGQEKHNDSKPTQNRARRLEALLSERGFSGDVFRHAAFDVAYGVRSRDDLDRGQVEQLVIALEDDESAAELLEAANELLAAEEES